jgi:hypothetical protein
MTYVAAGSNPNPHPHEKSWARNGQMRYLIRFIQPRPVRFIGDWTVGVVRDACLERAGRLDGILSWYVTEISILRLSHIHNEKCRAFTSALVRMFKCHPFRLFLTFKLSCGSFRIHSLVTSRKQTPLPFVYINPALDPTVLLLFINLHSSTLKPNFITSNLNFKTFQSNQLHHVCPQRW